MPPAASPAANSDSTTTTTPTRRRIRRIIAEICRTGVARCGRSPSGQQPQERTRRARIDPVLPLEALRLRPVRQRQDELLTRRPETARRPVDRRQDDLLREPSDAAGMGQLARLARRAERVRLR